MAIARFLRHYVDLRGDVVPQERRVWWLGWWLGWWFGDEVVD